MENYDEQLNLRKRHPLGKFHLLHNELQSCFTRLRLPKSLNVSYGDSAGEKLDIFPASQPNAPVLVFIHGGYFRALDKRQYSYIANPFVGSGCTVVLVNYDLAPSVSVETIIDQNRAAFIWIYENVHKWNGDHQNITICGHSVGAFLAAKIIEFDWEPEIRKGISGAVLLSGLYDLSSMRQSYLNKTLRLTDDDVACLNPSFANIESFPYIVVAVGENETDEFIRQSRNYFDKLQTANVSSEFLLLENKNHYTVSRMLSDKNNHLMKRMLNICSV